MRKINTSMMKHLVGGVGGTGVGGYRWGSGTPGTINVTPMYVLQ